MGPKFKFYIFNSECTFILKSVTCRLSTPFEHSPKVRTQPAVNSLIYIKHNSNMLKTTKVY